MKVTQIMLAKGFGGAERLFVDLCLTLTEFEQDIHAICSSGSESAKILSACPGIKLDEISILGNWDPFAPTKIKRLLQKNNSEVVQAHLARAAWLGGKACRMAGLPLLVTTHNYIDTKYYRYVTMLVPPTMDQYQFYLKKGISATRLQKINHFSPLQPAASISETNPNRLRIVTLGRLVRKKGFHILLDAFAKLAATEVSCELVIGGNGPEKSALLTQIDSLDLANKVTLTGWVSDVKEFLQGASLFVLPSLHEPFGIVILEAMALGVPIVTSATQGPAEILDESCAWFCKTGDIDSLAEALLQACTEPSQRRIKSEIALNRFKLAYSKQAVIPEFIQLFDSLVKAEQVASLHL